jgi:Spy/CpxP family protein refolding chaperone
MMIWIRSCLLALASLAAVSSATAQVPFPPPPHEVLRTQADELGLDEATVDQIMAIALGAREQRMVLREAVDIARTQLDAVLLVDVPDETTVIAALEMLADAELALRTHDLRTLLAMRALLTPDQRAAFAELYGQPPASGMNPHRPPPGQGPPGSPPVP